MVTPTANSDTEDQPLLPITLQTLLEHMGRKEDLFFVTSSEELLSNERIFRPHKTNMYSILLMQTGSLSIRLGPSTFELTAGSVFVKSRPDIHQITGYSKDCRFLSVSFTEELIGAVAFQQKQLEAISFLSQRQQPQLHTTPDQTASLLLLFTFLRAKSLLPDKPLFYEAVTYHAFAALMLETAALYSQQEKQTLSKITVKEQLTFRFLNLLRHHIREERSVNFYATQLHVTPKYLSQCVKDVSGHTCGEIIDDLVILEARVLLDDPGLSIAQVADELNFSDQFFFSKFFKRVTGQTPSAYRMSL